MTGLVGGGVHSPLGSSPLYVDIEGLLGAAGGGGLNVGGGLVWQANAGLGYQVTEKFSVIGSMGYIDAAKGEFQAKVLGLAVAYHFTAFSQQLD